MLGERLSHYRITGRLGAGGMGVVYEAQDVTLGRLVAIKVLPPGLLADRATLLRFQREARAASALNHPHICIVHELGEHEDRPFIVMERLQGRTLKHALRAGPLDCAMLLDLAWQIADALDAAHRAGIVHRDLKPDNIFVTQQQVVKLLDFGLAKLVAGHAAANAEEAASAATLEEPITEIGRAMGTPLYMSPEQMRGEDVDCRTDLFSFGAVLYEMATGRRAFAGATSEAVRPGMPAPPSAEVAGLPAGFDALVAKALEKDRALRYQTAADLKANLARLRRDSEAALAVLDPAAAVRPPDEGAGASAARRRVLPRWSWAAGAAILVTAGIALWTGRAASVAPRHSGGPRFSSLAVLPLENLARDAEQQYLRRRHDGGAHHEPVGDSQPARHLPHVVAARARGPGQATAGDCPPPERRCSRRRHGYPVGRPRSHLCPTDRDGRRPDGLGECLRARLPERARPPGRRRGRDRPGDRRPPHRRAGARRRFPAGRFKGVPVVPERPLFLEHVHRGGLEQGDRLLQAGDPGGRTLRACVGRPCRLGTTSSRRPSCPRTR